MKFAFRAALSLCLLAGFALVESPHALAQSSTRPMPKVVTACGTPPYTYTAGNYEFVLQDVNGNLCTTGSGGGGGPATLASGSVASGAYAAGSISDGASPNIGTSTDAASCSSGTSLLACARQFHADASAGVAAPASTFPASAVGIGCRAATAQPTAVTDGQLVAPMCSTGGKFVMDLYAPSAFRVSGTTTSTNTSAHTIIAAGAGSLKNYITGVQCGRTDAGTSPIVLTFSDAQSSIMILPNGGNGGANNMAFDSPLATAAATAFTVTSGTSTTTVYCNAQGYQAP